MWKLVENTSRKFGSATRYWVEEGPSGEMLALTELEVARGVERAKRNPEDLPAKTGLTEAEHLR